MKDYLQEMMQVWTTDGEQAAYDEALHCLMKIDNDSSYLGHQRDAIISLIKFLKEAGEIEATTGGVKIVLDYVALVILIVVILVLFYGIIVIHDIPYEITVKRNHPHQDVLHVAGWQVYLYLDH